MKRFLMFAWLVIPVLCWGQPQGPDTVWMRVFSQGTDHNYLMQVKQTPDGGTILVGYAHSGNTPCAVLAKLTSDGQTQWQHTYLTVQSDAYCVLPTDSGYVFSGDAHSILGYSAYLTKTDSLGQVLWNRPMTAPNHDALNPWSIEAAHGSGFVIGLDRGDGAVLLRTDAQGQELWRQLYVLEEGHMAWHTTVLPTADGGYYVGSTGGAETADYYLLKTDSAGQFQWTYHYGGPDDDIMQRMTLLPDGGCLLVGFTSYLNSDALEIFLVRTNTNGDTVWTRRFSQFGYSVAADAVVDSSGGILVLGNHRSSSGPREDLLLFKVDDNGETIWSRDYGTEWNDWAISLAATDDGGVVMGGQTLTADTSYEALVIRTEPINEAAAQPVIVTINGLRLSPSFPNPFNSATEIRFDLQKAEKVKLKVFDVLGKEVDMLEDGMMQAGSHRVRFDGSGRPSGVYFARLEACGAVNTEKMMLLK